MSVSAYILNYSFKCFFLKKKQNQAYKLYKPYTKERAAIWEAEWQSCTDQQESFTEYLNVKLLLLILYWYDTKAALEQTSWKYLLTAITTNENIWTFFWPAFHVSIHVNQKA